MAMAEMFEAIDTCPAPVIARVHGAALGGGMGLCAVADLVIAESGARFGFTETKLGILPAVISPYVIAKIGESHARAVFPAGGGSMPCGRSGSAWSTRSWRAWTRWTPRSMPPSRLLRPGRRRHVPRRRSSARSADCRTDRRSGTPRASSRRSARHPRRRKAFAPSTRSAARPGRSNGTTRRSVAIAEFALERYFARWEFAAKHLLCASDLEAWPMSDLLELADPEARALWNGLRLGYTESTGHPLLRAEIAALYDTLTAEDILVFAGAEEAIFCLSYALLGPGDHAIVTWPGYQSSYEVARSVGADVTLHDLREADGWGLDVQRLISSIRPETRLIAVNAPHNPTGMLPTASEWRALTEACASAGIHLLADEVYRFLEFQDGDRVTAGADALPGLGISIGVMSKSFALAGLRIGWIATKDRDVLARCAGFKDYTTICSSAPSEILALIGLRAREAVLGRSRGIVAANLALLDPFFERWAGTFDWVRPRGGSIGFPRLTAAVGIDAFAAELVEAEGVLLAPGSIFGFPGEHFRLGFGRTDMPEALAGLERFAERRLR